MRNACRGWSAHPRPEEDVSHEQGLLFGVRRPLRFMAQRLELSEQQIKTLATILNELKTERAQAAVDDQRTVALFADALEAAPFDGTKADRGLELRIQSAERLRAAVRSALERSHAMLTPDQRARLAYMLRSGVLSI
ncbi:MAG: Spy/CpxP family protein refolding chaperone [Myxococcota bacterium]